MKHEFMDKAKARKRAREKRMAVEKVGGALVITGEHIGVARLIALKGAVRLEGTGMKHSSGKSMRKVACRELGLSLRMSHDDVIGHLQREIDKRLKKPTDEETP